MHNYKIPIKPTQQSITLHNAQLLKVETTQKCVPVSVSQITMAHRPFCFLITLNTSIPTYCFGETTLLVPEVYPMCAISPSSLKRAQLVS